jgi:hypothetical protein
MQCIGQSIALQKSSPDEEAANVRGLDYSNKAIASRTAHPESNTIASKTGVVL